MFGRGFCALLLSATCAASVAAAPAVEIAPSSLDFGSQTVGTRSAKSIRITNSGDALLSLADVSLTGNDAGDFAITADTVGFGFAPGGLRQVILQFTPSAAGRRNAFLSISSNAPGKLTLVPMTGLGVGPGGGTPVVVPAVSGYAAPTARGVPILSAASGARVLILGANLGTRGTVAFNGVLAPPAISWSPTEILVTVPPAPAYPFSGPVTVTVEGRSAAGPTFTITSPPPPPVLGNYTPDRIVQVGDTVGEIGIEAGGHFEVGTLNNAGQLTFVTTNHAGDRVLVQYADGKFAPLFYPGPLQGPVKMNQLGSSVATVLGALILTDDSTQSVTVVARAGMQAGAGVTFSDLGEASINNQNEIAFGATVVDGLGQERYGIFFLGRNRTLLRVAVQGQSLPGLAVAAALSAPSLDDMGGVAFLALPCSPGPNCTLGSFIYSWQNGTITPLGADDRQDGKVWRYSRNDAVLLGTLNGDSFRLLANGKIGRLVEPNQEMPGGGRLARVSSTSDPNDAGQVAFIASLTDGATATYLLDASGNLSLVLKSGTPTKLGVIRRIGQGEAGTGVALNSQGDVALPVAINGSPDAIILMTPSPP